MDQLAAAVKSLSDAGVPIPLELRPFDRSTAPYSAFGGAPGLTVGDSPPGLSLSRNNDAPVYSTAPASSRTSFQSATTTSAPSSSSSGTPQGTSKPREASARSSFANGTAVGPISKSSTQKKPMASPARPAPPTQSTARGAKQAPTSAPAPTSKGGPRPVPAVQAPVPPKSTWTGWKVASPVQAQDGIVAELQVYSITSHKLIAVRLADERVLVPPYVF